MIVADRWKHNCQRGGPQTRRLRHRHRWPQGTKLLCMNIFFSQKFGTRTWTESRNLKNYTLLSSAPTQHKIYYINRQRDCSTEHSIPAFEWHMCIPDDADYDGEERIGSGVKDEGVLAHAWRWRADEPFEGREAAGVTEKDCTPVWRDFSGRNEREKCTSSTVHLHSYNIKHAEVLIRKRCPFVIVVEVHAYNGYADFKVGIKNPSVFDVPKPCRDVVIALLPLNQYFTLFA